MDASRRVICAVLLGISLVACIDEPEFQSLDDRQATLAAEGTPDHAGAGLSPAGPDASVTPAPQDGGPSGDAAADDEDAPPATLPPTPAVPCGGKTCSHVQVCCKNKCQPAKKSC